MPAAYTHHLVARKTLKSLPADIQNKINVSLPLYFFGAQGADFCFFYPSLGGKSKNLGSYLHRKGGYTAFCVLKALSSRDPAILSYALGYVTHYAVDSVFHPFVYATSNNSPLLHSRIENTLDQHFKQRSSSAEHASFFRKKLTEQEESELFFIYTAIAVRCGFPALKKTAFTRALALFNAYPPITSTVFGNQDTHIKTLALNKEKWTWKYPAAPEIIRNDSADELFLISVTQASLLIQSFCHATANSAALSPNLFGKNYLTGI